MSDLNLLMSRIEEINLKSPPYTPADITDLIAYHRASRASKASGVKPAKPATRDLASIMGTITKPKAGVPTFRKL